MCAIDSTLRPPRVVSRRLHFAARSELALWKRMGSAVASSTGSCVLVRGGRPIVVARFDALHVGFCFVLLAIAMLVTSVWLVAPLQARERRAPSSAVERR